MSWSQGVFLSVLLLCMLVVGTVIRHDVLTGQANRASSQYQLQRYIGGVGMGAVTVPAWNFSDYDPRLEVAADDSFYPIPGGYSFSPDRLGMVTSFSAD